MHAVRQTSSAHSEEDHFNTIAFIDLPTMGQYSGEGEGEGIAILDRVMKKTTISLLTTKWYGFRFYQ
jgi:hypothetical protein